MTEPAGVEAPRARERRARLGRWLRRGLALAALAAVVGLVLLLGLDVWIARATAARIHERVDEVPPREVALVLGTSKYAYYGRPNRHYENRLDAAAALFRAGKVGAILVSGDNSSASYDEPSAMKADLVARGVPEACITADYAGFRTLDSVVRAREVFGLQDYVLVSQRFHLERALYLAEALGHDAQGLTAADVPGPIALRVRGREVLARLNAWLDLHLLDTQPRFLGPRETVARCAAPDAGASAAGTRGAP